jgi:hypothetical protein
LSDSKFPSDDEIIDLVKQNGSIAGAANKLSMPKSTLKDYIGRQGIKAQVDAGREQSLRQTIATDDDEYVPVDDPMRIAADQAKAEIRH